MIGMTENQERMLVENMGLVYYVVNNRTFPCESLTRDDLIQEGLLGLMHAVQHYSVDWDTAFSTYAIPVITGYIKRAVTRDKLVHIPENKVHEIRKGTEDVSHKEEAEMFMYGLLSLDMPVHADDERDESVLGDFVKDEGSNFTENIEMNELRSIVGKYMVKLSDKEQFVIVNRFGLDGSTPATMETVGQLMGVTKQRVEQIQKSALGKLKRIIKMEDIEPYLAGCG